MIKVSPVAANALAQLQSSGTIEALAEGLRRQYFDEWTYQDDPLARERLHHKVQVVDDVIRDLLSLIPNREIDQ